MYDNDSQSQIGDPTIRTVINRTRRPIKITLSRGKTLYIGPAWRGQVHDDTLERPAFKKLIEAEEVEVLGEDASPSVPADGASARLHRSARGHPATRKSSRKGDR